MSRRMENQHSFKPVAVDEITPQVTLGEDGILYVDFSQYDRITLASF